MPLRRHFTYVRVLDCDARTSSEEYETNICWPIVLQCPLSVQPATQQKQKPNRRAVITNEDWTGLDLLHTLFTCGFVLNMAIISQGDRDLQISHRLARFASFKFCCLMDRHGSLSAATPVVSRTFLILIIIIINLPVRAELARSYNYALTLLGKAHPVDFPCNQSKADLSSKSNDFLCYLMHVS